MESHYKYKLRDCNLNLKVVDAIQQYYVLRQVRNTSLTATEIKAKKRNEKRKKRLHTMRKRILDASDLTDDDVKDNNVSLLRDELEDAKRMVRRCKVDVELRLEEFELLREWHVRMTAHMNSVKGVGVSEHVRSVVKNDLRRLGGDIESARAELLCLNDWKEEDLVRVQKLKRDSRSRCLLSSFFSLVLRPRMGNDAGEHERARIEKAQPPREDSVVLRTRREMALASEEDETRMMERARADAQAALEARDIAIEEMLNARRLL